MDSVDVANTWVQDTGCKLVDLVSDDDAVSELVEVLNLRRFDARRLQKVLENRKSQLVDGEEAVDPDELLACKGPPVGDPVLPTAEAIESPQTLQAFGMQVQSSSRSFSGTCTFGSRSNSRTLGPDDEKDGATCAHALSDESVVAVSLAYFGTLQSVEPPEYLPGSTGTTGLTRPKTFNASHNMKVDHRFHPNEEEMNYKIYRGASRSSDGHIEDTASLAPRRSGCSFSFFSCTACWEDVDGLR